MDTATSKAGAPSVTRSSSSPEPSRPAGPSITNNLPYILQITQFGTSQQAAPGADHLTANWQARLE